MKFDEIGSEYWKADLQTDKNKEIVGAVYTASGRSAQSLIIATAEIDNKRALLPAYTCQHIVEPFAWNGWIVDFYDINMDLSPNIESFKEKLKLNPGCIVVEGYYGFPTAKNLVELLHVAQKQGIIIIEDITHSFLNDQQLIFADANYLFCSLRKWSGLSDGGYAISLKGKQLFVPQKFMTEFTLLRHEAREQKSQYVKYLNKNIKDKYLELYSLSENILDGDIGIYAMSEQAYDDYTHLDLEFIKSKRRENFTYLVKNLISEYIVPIFTDISSGVCPIMFPVYISNYRDEIRKELIDNRIYCPVHWPVPIQLDDIAKKNSECIYNSIMSIPCDQRYSIDDMERLVTILNNYTGEVKL